MVVHRTGSMSVQGQNDQLVVIDNDGHHATLLTNNLQFKNPKQYSPGARCDVAMNTSWHVEQGPNRMASAGWVHNERCN